MTTNVIQTQATRDAALDGLRAIAIVRVILWHTTGWLWTTWTVSSIPAMFIVTGALISRTSSRQSTMYAVKQRLKRLIPPLWFYGTIVLGLCIASGIPVRQPWRFFFPVLQPSANIANQWFTSAMWYLRAYVWVLILAPALVVISRRMPRSGVVIGAILLVVASTQFAATGAVGWMMSDIVLYSLCTLIGMSFFHEEVPSPRTFKMLALATAVAALIWLQWRTPSQNIVNNDHVLHFFLGLFWISVLLLNRPLLVWVSRTRLARFLNSAPLSIYLWHPFVAWFVWQLLPNHLGAIRPLYVFGLTMMFLAPVLYVVKSWEHRPLSSFIFTQVPTRLLTVSCLVGIVALHPFGNEISLRTSNKRLPLAPSQAPSEVSIMVDPQVLTFLENQKDARDLHGSRENLMATVLKESNDSMKLGGIRAHITTKSGESWSFSIGDAGLVTGDTNIGSITKTLTTTLLFQQVALGRLTLDQPVGDLGVKFAYPQLTIRQLLTHRSGLAPYDHLTSGMKNRNGLTPESVLRWAGMRPLAFTPGSKTQYSSTGYVALGLLLEQVTKQQYEDLVEQEISRRYKLEINIFRGQYKSVGYSTGGASMNLVDLAKWGRLYIFDRTVSRSPWPWEIRGTTGLGVHAYCPCTTDSFMALGHMGGRTHVSVDGDGVVVVIDSPGVLVGRNYAMTQSLIQQLRLIAGGGKTPLYIKK